MKTVKIDNVLCLTELRTGWVPSLLTAKVHSIIAQAMSSIYFKKVLKTDNCEMTIWIIQIVFDNSSIG